MKKKKAFVCMPTHGSLVDLKAHTALLGPSCREDIEVTSAVQQRSLLAAGFNEFWCRALNDRYDYFAMLHADIAPQQWWFDILLGEMERTGADIISAVVPLKDEKGLTSTAIGTQGKPWTPLRRLTLSEVHQLPMTFGVADAGYPGDELLVNTGCFLVDLSKPWCREPDHEGNHFRFTINDRVTCNRGMFMTEVEPEDWNASRAWARRGLKVFATRKVAVNHRGATNYPNHTVWGTLREDFSVSEAKMAGNDLPYRTADDKEVIHIHVPKTGGTSIWSILGKPAEFSYRVTHSSLDEWRNALGVDRFDNAITVSVCRNPYDRLYSAWSYFANNPPVSPLWPDIETNMRWVQHHSGPDCTFEHFLMSANDLGTKPHFRQQTNWLAKPHGDGTSETPAVDYLLRFESLDEEWAEFCALVGLDVEPLPHENASEHGPWEDAYTPEMIERVNHLYAQDFDALPYEMLSPEQFAGSPALTA